MKTIIRKINKFALIDFYMLQYFKGNLQAFGWKTALISMSPLLSYILYFKHRNKTLDIDPTLFDDEGNKKQ